MIISKILGTLGVAMASLSAPAWTLTWTLSSGDTNGAVQNYNFYFESTTNQAVPTQFATANGGVSALTFSPTNFPNPCFLVAQAIGSNGNVSAYSAPYLFDTNSYPGPPSFLRAHP
jgi:hypothetical protein